MADVTIGVPFITQAGRSERAQYRRDFSGSMSEGEKVPFIAKIIRKALEESSHPERERLSRRADDFLVSSVTLVMSVPDEVWKENGLFPVGDWYPVVPKKKGS